MTNSVTFPVNLGGDGSTVTDDDNASTGLGNGGHRTRFVPAMGQVVAVANVLTQRLASQSDTSSSSRAIATGSTSFVTAGFYEWAIGMYVMASSAASTSNWMYGQVTAWNTSTNTVTVNVVSSNGSGTYADWVVSLAGPANLSTLPSTIDVSSTSAALRVTQRGSGNALLVEDSTNPDSTPVVVNTSGQVVIGHTAALISGSGINPNFQTHGLSNNTSAIGFTDWQASAYSGPFVVLSKSRSGVIGTNTILQSGDRLGILSWGGDDGTKFVPAAEIVAFVDGTPGLNDMPGRMIFNTTADGASSTTERMRIDSTGSVGIGGSGGAAYTLRCAKSITGATTVYNIASDATILNDVDIANLFYAAGRTEASGFLTLTNLRYFTADQSTFGAGSSVTNQFGFSANSTLTGATNNYGFYSNIASGTGRWGFYSAGTAPNYFAGAVGINGIAQQGYFEVFGDGETAGITASTASGNATFGVRANDYTSLPSYRGILISQYCASATGTSMGYSNASLARILIQNSSSAAIYTNGANKLGFGTFGTESLYIDGTQSVWSVAPGSGTNGYGFNVSNAKTGATNNYGFYSSIASGTGRWGFYSAGTADNYFEGNVKTNGTLAGGYLAHTAGTTAMALGSDKVVKVTPNASTSYTTTVAPAGATAKIIIVTSGTTSYSVSFGTGFLATGPLTTGTVTAKTFVISFVSDGITMIESSRTTAM